MKHGFTTTHQRPSNSQNNGFLWAKKTKVGLSANKVLATIFWDARGIIPIDYLQKGRAINGEYYAHLLDRFNDNLKK
jgi:Transposase.